MFHPQHTAILLAFASFATGYSFCQGADANNTDISFPETTEAFFPVLRTILAGLESKAPNLLEERERINEARANRMVADSKRGFRLSVGANAYSLHEDRPNSDYYHRYRFLASAYVRKPLYHWGALRAESRIAQRGPPEQEP